MYRLEGLKKGSIVDIDETVHSIRKAFDQAERMVGFPLKKPLSALMEIIFIFKIRTALSLFPVKTKKFTLKTSAG